MTLYTQIPGLVNITATHGDDFELPVDFDISLSGRTFSSKVILASSNTPVTLTVTPVDLPEGKIKISLAKSDLLALPKAKHRWYFSWTYNSSTQNILAGDFMVIDYP